MSCLMSSGSPTDDARGAAAQAAGRRLDAVIEREFRALLEQYPTAPLVAVNANGLVADMPDSVPRSANPVLKGRSSLDGVPAEEHGRLIAAFDTLLTHGMSQCVLHPPGYAEVTWHGFDLRGRHGVIVGVITADGEAPAAAAAVGTRDMVRAGPPRFATIRKDERSFIVGVSGAMSEILGWSADELLGRRSLDFVHPGDHPLAIDNWMEMLADPGPSRRVRQRLKHKDGSWVWFEITNNNLLEDPDHSCVVAEMVDISDEMAAQEALRAREQLLNRLAEAIPVGLFQIDTEGGIVYTNDRLHEILGVERSPTVEAQLATIVPDDCPTLERAIAEVLERGSHADIEVACLRPGDADFRYCTIGFRALRHDDGAISGAIACVADVTDSALLREQLKFRASFDELTGCHNRASIMAALEADIERDPVQAERAVMFVDLDRFKAINDRHGHAAGDELLRRVARLLRESMRENDLVGRTGGDEFLVICPDVGGAERAVGLAERLAEALRDGIRAEADELCCSVSIGVAWSSGNTSDADTLVAAADAAMYQAKRAETGEPRLG
jgi:diguanylate cyclase (GGDEF)-like protein/PAS domain S-box-containing protein